MAKSIKSLQQDMLAKLDMMSLLVTSPSVIMNLSHLPQLVVPYILTLHLNFTPHMSLYLSPSNALSPSYGSNWKSIFRCGEKLREEEYVTTATIINQKVQQ